MLKAVVAATAAVTIAGSSMAYAQRDERAEGTRRWQPTTEDMRAFQAARLAALRAGLTLTPEQDKHWPAFEQAMRELQQLRLNRIAAIRDARREGRPQSHRSGRAHAPARHPACRKVARCSSGSPKRPIRSTAASTRRSGGASRSSPVRKVRAAGSGLDATAASAECRAAIAAPTRRLPTAVQTFTRKTVDGDVFAQAFIGRTIDGVMVGRVFGTKTVDGDLAIGEAVVFSGKTLEPIAFSGKFTGNPGTFGAKLTSTEVTHLRPQDHDRRAGPRSGARR